MILTPENVKEVNKNLTYIRNKLKDLENEIRKTQAYLEQFET